jgi:uncharacterized protein YbcI
MDQTAENRGLMLAAVSNAMVKLHKEQFGRGPNQARSYFAGPDMLVCLLTDVLLPAERAMAELGDDTRVRDSRTSFQAATAAKFVTAVEQIVLRKVRAFASGVDVGANIVFENFYFESQQNGDAETEATA